jgi:glycosyltransferase involved in cell wall biosynthesis
MEHGGSPVRILWVKADKLLPVHCGGNIRTFGVVRELAAQYQLSFFSYYGGEPDLQYERDMKQHLPDAVCLCAGYGRPNAWGYLLRLARSAPYAVSRFASSEVQARLASWFKEQCFDVAVCDFLDAAINFPRELTIPTVLFQHNVESEIWRRHAITQSHPAKKLMYRLEYTKMARYERDIVKRFHHVIAVSEHDRQLMSKWVDPSHITVVPTGVDLRQFRPGPSASAPLVMFIGAMDWEPNVDAVEYFCREIWPAILAKVPESKFRIVGRNPDRRVLSLRSDSVEVTGSVPSVIDHLRDAAAVVVPLRIGGGTRLKIYEAMAMGKAVVSTSVGAEGLDVHQGQDIILADEPSGFAESVVMLLRNSELRQRYEGAAARLAAQYDWSAVGTRFAEALHAAGGKMREGGLLLCRSSAT